MRELLDVLLTRKSEESDTTTAEAITGTLIERALSGDTRAYEIIRDTLGEKPIERKEARLEGNFSIKWKE